MRHLIWKLALSGCLLMSPRLICAQETRRPLTVADSVEATRVLNHFSTSPALISPDNKKYLIVLQRGDIAHNGSWVELLSGGTSSLDAACKFEIVAKLFSRSTALVTNLIKDVRWLEDSKHVAFLWDSGLGTPEIVVVNAQTRQLSKITNHPTQIVMYDISGDGKTIIYSARESHDTAKLAEMWSEGFAVVEQDLTALLQGDIDGWVPWSHYETFSESGGQKHIRKISEPAHKWYVSPDLLDISPDGRYAITVRPADSVPEEWDRYTEHVFKDVYLPPAREHPDAPNAIRQYYIVDIKASTARPLWNAPENPYGKVIWSPDSRSLILGPTFLPASEADATGLSGRAVVEISVPTGDYVRIPLPENLTPHSYRAESWNKSGVIQFSVQTNPQQDAKQLTFTKRARRWTPVTEETPKEQTQARVRIEIRQDPNTPQALYAVEVATGAEQLIRDLNPKLRNEVTLGGVELVHWKGLDGKPWTGMLYYPVHYAGGHRFPLVIQTHGYSPTEFSLDGPFTTAFAAQPLANQDIAVLQLNSPDSGMEDTLGTPREPEAYVAGYEGAIEAFTKAGLVDRAKVGIVGFSRTGWHVEYALTHSQFRFAAAEVADNMDCSYVPNVLWQYSQPSECEADNGALPFGKGLEKWLQVAPGFNTDKIHTPLRMEIDSGPAVSGFIGNWEIFNNLRYLGKPVELFVIPDIAHGVHVLQNPAQRLASQGGTVDWFRFWLKGEEDPNPAKVEQYTRWHKLRELQRQNEGK